MDAYNNVGIDSIETAKNLKKLRIENNLKLKQVRDAIGLSAEQTVCSWESKTHPKLPSIIISIHLKFSSLFSKLFLKNVSSLLFIQQ